MQIVLSTRTDFFHLLIDVVVYENAFYLWELTKLISYVAASRVRQKERKKQRTTTNNNNQMDDGVSKKGQK